jgi:hypothetical protein
MDQHNNPDLDQADADILTYTVSDEALESAAGTGGGCSSFTCHFLSFGLEPERGGCCG